MYIFKFFQLSKSSSTALVTFSKIHGSHPYKKLTKFSSFKSKKVKMETKTEFVLKSAKCQISNISKWVISKKKSKFMPYKIFSPFKHFICTSRDIIEPNQNVGRRNCEFEGGLSVNSIARRIGR